MVLRKLTKPNAQRSIFDASSGHREPRFVTVCRSNAHRRSARTARKNPLRGGHSARYHRWRTFMICQNQMLRSPMSTCFVKNHVLQAKGSEVHYHQFVGGHDGRTWPGTLA